jgi:hypothetical protein
VIIWRKISWALHEARMGERRGVYVLLVGKPKGKDNFGNPGIDE